MRWRAGLIWYAVPLLPPAAVALAALTALAVVLATRGRLGLERAPAIPPRATERGAGRAL